MIALEIVNSATGGNPPAPVTCPPSRKDHTVNTPRVYNIPRQASTPVWDATGRQWTPNGDMMWSPTSGPNPTPLTWIDLLIQHGPLRDQPIPHIHGHAVVTVNSDNTLADTSTVTVNGKTWPVPLRCPRDTILGDRRIAIVLIAHGLKRTPGADLDYSQPGLAIFPVTPIA